MFVALARNQAMITLGDRGTGLRVTGLVILAVAGYLALAVPPRLRSQRQAREAQIGIALYAVMTTAFAGAVALACTIRPHGWFKDDQLCDPSTFTLLAVLMMFAGLLALVGSQKLGAQRFNLGCLLTFPYLVLGTLESILLCYYWFGPRVRAAGSDPGGSAAIALAATAMAVAALAVGGALYSLLSSAEYRASLSRVLPAALIATMFQACFIALRAPHTAYSAQQLYGADLILSGAVIGALTYIYLHRSGGIAQEQPKVYELAA